MPPDHDITLTAEADMCHQCGEDLPVSCCDYFLELRNYTVEEMPENCWPIPIIPDDPVFVGKVKILSKNIEDTAKLRSNQTNHDLQLRKNAIVRLLNRSCVNEVTLTGQNLPLRCC